MLQASLTIMSRRCTPARHSSSLRLPSPPKLPAFQKRVRNVHTVEAGAQQRPIGQACQAVLSCEHCEILPGEQLLERRAVDVTHRAKTRQKAPRDMADKILSPLCTIQRPFSSEVLRNVLIDRVTLR